MPSNVSNLTATADRVQTIAIIPIDGTNIISLGALSVTAGISPVSAFAEIGILEGGELYANRIAVLAQGYIGASSSINWSGEHNGESQQFAYLSIWSNAANTYRLTLLSKGR